MSHSESERDREIDRLVRAHLRHQGEQSDPRAGLARVRATLRADQTASRREARPPHRARWGWGLAVAATLLVGLGLFLPSGPTRVSAETIVQQAIVAHTQPIDRCYLVEVRFEPGAAAPVLPLLNQNRQLRLWTRGDRFWVAPAYRTLNWSWGREENGAFWLAVGPHHGIRFDVGEAPEPLQLLAELGTLRVETLLTSLLRDFDLQRLPGPDSPTTWSLQATPKSTQQLPNLRSVVLEVDPASKVVQRLVLTRAVPGRPVATVTFTLTDTQTLSDDSYRLEGHLTAPFEIYHRGFEPNRRGALFLRLLTNRASEARPAPPGSNRSPE